VKVGAATGVVAGLAGVTGTASAAGATVDAGAADAALSLPPLPQADSKAAVALPPASGSSGAPVRILTTLRRDGSNRSCMAVALWWLVSLPYYY
jgi:hypothetical protein